MIKLTTTAPQPNENKNIFSTPVLAGRALEQEHIKRLYKRNATNAYMGIGIMTAVLIAYSVAFLYPQLNTYLQAPDQIAQAEQQIDKYDSITLPGLEKEKSLHKSAYDEQFKNVEGALDKVFPSDADKLGIIKMLEDFATSVNAKTPPFEFNSISFEEPKVMDGYTILPMTTTIQSSRTNFDRFLQLVNLSGKFDSDVQIRLLEISNITIRYRGIDARTGEDRGVDFTVKLNAYSR